MHIGEQCMRRVSELLEEAEGVSRSPSDETLVSQIATRFGNHEVKKWRADDQVPFEAEFHSWA